MQSEQLRQLKRVNLMSSVLWFSLNAVSGQGEIYDTCGSSKIIRLECKYLVVYQRLLEAFISSFMCVMWLWSAPSRHTNCGY